MSFSSSTSSPEFLSFISPLKDSKKVIILSGAGISTSAGIPDFRTPGTGLYSNLQAYNLPYAEAIFHIDYFLFNPYPFYTLSREMLPGLFKPTDTHWFVRYLQDRRMLLRNYTQNIDCLEREAGVNEDVLVEAHGSFNDAKCVGRGVMRRRATEKVVPKVEEKERKLAPRTETIIEGTDSSEEEDDDDRDMEKFISPSCSKSYTLSDFRVSLSLPLPLCLCGGLIKPNITFFGEQLPQRFHTLSQIDMEQCDFLIVLGTSLKVHPFAGLITKVPKNCKRLLVNLERVGEFRGGFDFEKRSKKGEEGKEFRDFWLEMMCDEAVEGIVKALGEDLRSFRREREQKENVKKTFEEEELVELIKSVKM